MNLLWVPPSQILDYNQMNLLSPCTFPHLHLYPKPSVSVVSVAEKHLRGRGPVLRNGLPQVFQAWDPECFLS